jgi:hypothetical protein
MVIPTFWRVLASISWIFAEYDHNKLPNKHAGEETWNIINWTPLQLGFLWLALYVLENSRGKHIPTIWVKYFLEIITIKSMKHKLSKLKIKQCLYRHLNSKLTSKKENFYRHTWLPMSWSWCIKMCASMNFRLSLRHITWLLHVIAMWKLAIIWLVGNQTSLSNHYRYLRTICEHINNISSLTDSQRT